MATAASCLSVFAGAAATTVAASSRLMSRRAVACAGYAGMDDGGGGEGMMIMARRRRLVVPGIIATAGGGVRLRPATKGAYTCARAQRARGPSLATDQSLDIERANVHVAYQGSPGTAIEEMVFKAFPDCIAVPCKKFVAAFEAVDSSLADIVVLPIENSSTGSFHQNYDLLLRHKLHIVQEVQVEIELCLWALPGVQKNDLRTIFSHPEEFAQCEHSLSSLRVIKKNVDHCAAGAEIISMQNLGDAGVIGNAQAAELYGLNIVECNFQDASPNLTRYLVLAKTADIPKEYGQYKTSIVFGLEEGPGILFKALSAFWMRDINLSKIESRPNKREPMRTQGNEKHFNYIFYVDFEASTAEVRVQNALNDLKVQQRATFLRVLGCYQMREVGLTAPICQLSVSST
ncbi:arogenate dehydratase/prephenate dehydratase 2, chloroplastic isoform X4 [Oryza sativa Japonica Group]|uniref:arogenate dehydratase/prephenate dehydratase 2, chloroplastic isoform X4 n=1 Tax=Oryza sativa subsp. japonica TaxID=39947 RepID=UPI0007754A6D|nr:arogenate dehydratase/prephenate dehydratase 2, chloroplastic isoform X2 [Oryza sativa Japonica Group]